MLWLVTQMWTLLLLAFLFGAVAGVWTFSARMRRAGAAPEFGENAVKPALLLDAPDGGKDDLTQIIGIDRDTEARLNALGVYHLRQIAGWNDGAARWVEIRLQQPGRIARERWAEQAAGIA